MVRREQGQLESEEGIATVFDLMLEPNKKKNYQVPSEKALVDNAFLYILAGADTTAYTLSRATFHILESPSVHNKLRTELDNLPRDEHGRFLWKELAKAPYMVGDPDFGGILHALLIVKSRVDGSRQGKPENLLASSRNNPEDCTSSRSDCRRHVHTRRGKISLLSFKIFSHL